MITMEKKVSTDKPNNSTESTIKNICDIYINGTYPLMFFLLLCSYIVATFVDIGNWRIRIRSNQKWEKNVGREKWNNSTEEIILKTRSWGWTHLSSDVIVDSVIVLMLLPLRQIIVWK